MNVPLFMKYQQLIKDCFWEYDVTSADLVKMITSGNLQEKQFLFEKILANSTQLLHDLKIFPKDELEMLADSYKVPNFNHEYLSRRLNIIKYHFFDQKLMVEELKWIT